MTCDIALLILNIERYKRFFFYFFAIISFSFDSNVVSFFDSSFICVFIGVIFV